jgi:hypothetical protein
MIRRIWLRIASRSLLPKSSISLAGSGFPLLE